LAGIELSCRRPVLFLLANGLLRLMVGTVLALLTSYKLHGPDFLSAGSWLTFARVGPARLNAMVYGFASQAAIGVAIWLLWRLGRVPFMQGGLIVVCRWASRDLVFCCVVVRLLATGAFDLCCGRRVAGSKRDALCKSKRERTMRDQMASTV
jgi:cbb3-type cytochrome oxidase subunit 1